MKSSRGVGPAFLNGGGEMGKLTREKEWSSTSLGTPDTWSQSLAITLGILLNSQFPMFLWWGPELLCFYNDAYRKSLGENGKHPSILGMPAKKAWPEIWDTIEPLINQVLNGGEAVWMEDQLIPIFRNGHLEDVYWTFSYSPVKEDTDQVEGILVTCTETTGKIMNLQRAVASEKKFRDTVHQAPVGICILRGPDFIVEMANDEYLALVDRNKIDFVDRPLFDSLPEVEEAVGPVLNNVLLTGVPFYGNEFAAPIKRHGIVKTLYFNFIYKPLIDDDGKVSGIVVVANEITSLVEAKHAVLESEKQFRKMIFESPVPMTILRGKDHIIEIANNAMFKNIWRRDENSITGKKLLEVFPELKQQRQFGMLGTVMSTGKPSRENESVADIPGDNGMQRFYLDYEYAPLFERDGNVSGVLVTIYDVTDKVQARQEAEDAEARLLLALESANLATWELNLATNNLFYSQRLIEIFGHTPRTNLTLPEIVSQVYPADYPLLQAAYEDAVRTGRYDQEARIVKKDNSIAWIRVQGHLLFDQQVPVRMIGTIMDVTESKNAHQNTENLAAIVESSDDAIISKTLTGIITSWNPGAEKLFGYSSAEMINESIFKIIPPDRLNEEPAIIERIVLGERIEHFETKRLHKSGKLIDISLAISPLKDRNGKVIGASKIARDITGAVDAAKKIKETADRLKMAISATHLGTWDYHPLSGELSWSEECKKIYGIPDDVPIDFVAFSNHIYPQDSEFVQAAIQKSMDPQGDGSYDITYRIIRFDDQSVRWIRSQGQVGFDENRRAERFTGTVMDITDQKKAQGDLEESEQRTRLAIEAAEMGTFDWDLKTQELLTSPRLNHIFGYQGLTKITHHHLLDALLPTDREVRDRALKKAIAHGALGYEVRIAWPDKSIHWVRVFGKVISDDLQQPLRMYGTVMDITEEKTTLLALEDSKSRLTIAIQAAELGTWELNLKTSHTEYSERYLELLGFGKDEKPTHELLLSKIHPDDLRQRDAAVQHAIKTGILDHEMRVVPSGRSVRWLQSKGKVFYDENGTPERMLGTIMDVTEQRLAFDILQKSEERFRMLANFMPQFVWTADIDGNLNYFNEAVYRYSGLSKEEVLTGGWLQIVHPDERALNVEKWIHSINTGEDFIFEHRFRKSDGEYRWQLSRAIPVKDSAGQIQMWIGTSTDINDQKTFNERLQESELLFKTISNASPVGLWMTDKESKNTFVNDTWISWTGIPLEKQYGRGWLDRVIEEDRIEAPAKFAESVSKKEKFSSEFRIIRKDGELRWCLTEGSPYYDIDGAYAGYAGSVTDITERKMVEEELERKVNERTAELNIANLSLEKSNGELEQFAYVASHDLQEPLRKIKTFVSRLQESTEPGGSTQGAVYMEKIISASGRMSDLIRDLLEYSRTAKVTEQHVITDLNVILKNVLEDFELMINQREVTIEAEKLPLIYGVPHQMNQLFSNLINNSIKFSMEDRPPVITIKANMLSQEGILKHNLVTDHAYHELIFEDNGIGFSNEFAEKIFEIFQRLNARSSYAGSGIGLSICRKIVVNHQGVIYADSREEEGTRFQIILPALPF